MDSTNIEKIEIIVKEQEAGLRLDQFLAQKAELGFSRMRIQKLIKDGSICVDGAEICLPKITTKANMRICIAVEENKDWALQAENLPLDVLYEDADLLVINKPAGMVVHPGNGVSKGTLVHALLYHCGDSLSGIGGVKRPGIVHRLDKDTSGVMIVAKNDYAHQHLSKQFCDHGRNGVLKRSYKALIWGDIQPSIGSIHTFLGRAKYDRLKRAVVRKEASDAKEAITHYQVEARFYSKEENYTYPHKKVKPISALASLINCHLETGRTHQIRVHMAHIHHPLLGDKQYGAGQKSKKDLLTPRSAFALECLNRQALHAYFLQFSHPATNKLMAFESALPKDFADLVIAFEKEYLSG